MEDHCAVSSQNVFIEFDDQQKDRIAAALQALVDNMPEIPSCPAVSEEYERQKLLQVMVDDMAETPHQQPLSPAPKTEYELLKPPQVLVDEMPETSHQQPPSPATSEEYELLSVEDLEFGDEDVSTLKENVKPMMENMELVHRYLKDLVAKDKTADKDNVEVEEVLGHLNENGSLQENCEPAVSYANVASAPRCLNPVDELNNMSAVEKTSSKNQSNDSMVFRPTPADYGVVVISDEDSDKDTENSSDNCIDLGKDDEFLTNANSVVVRTDSLMSVSVIEKYLSYLCPECGIDCGDLSNWMVHIDTVHKIGKFEGTNMQYEGTKCGVSILRCNDCRKVFPLTTGSSKLINHRISHLPFKNYINCRICHDKYPNKRNFNAHFKRIHSVRVKSQPNDVVLEHIRIRCHICKEQQPNVDTWRLHLAEKHDYKAKVISKCVNIGKHSCICSICTQKVCSFNIISHMLVHENFKSFTCTYCNEFQTSQLQNAIKHVRVKHLYTSKIKCHYCKASFHTYSERKRHYVSEHKLKLHNCNGCCRSFVSLVGLMRHKSTRNHFFTKLRK